DLMISSLFIGVGLVFDVFDGWVARLLNAQSDLGKELDSLADVVSFGVAPAYLYVQLADPSLGWLGYIPSFILLAASAYRLANFNLLPSSKEFVGLPTPATAVFFVGIFIALSYQKSYMTTLIANNYFYFIIPILFAFLLNSKIKIFSLKSISKNWSENTYHLFLVLGLVVCSL
nr:CDP-alcohol phosphatidyltransferase family protein [Saprospiraceae bacterium]